MTTSTSGGVDLDQVLVIADDLRRICNRAIKVWRTHSAPSSKRVGMPRSPTSKTSTRDASPA